MKKQIISPAAPAAIGPYSQAIRTGNLIFISGQLPIDVTSGAMAEGVEAQTKQSLENIKAILAQEGCGMESVVKTTVFLANMGDFAAMNQVYGTYFSEPYPARAAFQVARLPQNALVEIEAVAEYSSEN